MHRASPLTWSSPRPTVLGRLVASGAGATIILLAAVGPVAALEPPDVTRTVEGTVQNIAVEEPGDTDGILQIATAVEVAGELYDLSDADVPAMETGQAVELELRSAADVPVAEALELAAAGQLDEAAVLSVEPDGTALDATVTLETAGAQSLVVLPVYWSTGPDAQVTALRELAQSTADYWAEQSGGTVTFSSIEARNWVQVAAPASCTNQAMLGLYSAAVAAQGVAGPTDTRHVAIYFPHTNLCGWAGMASIGGGMVWLNGPVNADVLAHETGHNLGLGHANTYTCFSSGARVALVVPLTGCTATAYGDYADVMGIAMIGRLTGSLNTALADQLGLARLTDLAGQATGVATIDLAALSAVGAGRGLRVPVAGGELYVDYRPAVGRDSRWPTWAGVQVHLMLLDARGIPTSYLLNMQPSAGAFADASLPVGQVWSIPGTNVTLRVASTAGVARIDVAIGTTLDNEATKRYVTRVYQDLFSRGVDSIGLAGWNAALTTGTPRVAVANGITYSDEYRMRLITGSYNRFLGRDPDPQGLQGWLGAMRQGVTIQQMESGFIASPEYYANSGGTDQGWIAKLYQHVLNRGPSTADIQGWLGALQGGANRDQVAMGFLLSTENLATVVNDQYLSLLHRGIDPAGRLGWVTAIQGGHRLEEVIGGIIASDEYFQLP